MLTANSAAILTDAFPREQRGMALGVNQIAALAGQFLGLVAGGLLAEIDWRAVFWVSVPFGIVRHASGRYRSLREIARAAPGADRLGRQHHVRRRDWRRCSPRSPTASSRTADHPTGWSNPVVLGGLAGGLLLLVAFCVIETRVAEPMFDLALFRIRAFARATSPRC